MRNNRDVSAKQQENIYNIVDFGAKGNGDFLNTKCIQKGIDTVHEAGGGKLIIPKGILLKSPKRLFYKGLLYGLSSV